MKRCVQIVVGLTALPLIGLVLLAGGIEMVRNLGHVWRLWNWPLLLSPAFYIYVLASFTTAWAPLWGVVSSAKAAL